MSRQRKTVYCLDIVVNIINNCGIAVADSSYIQIVVQFAQGHRIAQICFVMKIELLHGECLGLCRPQKIVKYVEDILPSDEIRILRRTVV